MTIRSLMGFVFSMFVAVLVLQAGVTHAQDDSRVTEAVNSGQITVPLSGRGLVSRISNLNVSPNSLVMGEVEIGTSTTMTATVTHSGDASSPAIEIGQVSLFGDAASEYEFAGFSGNQFLSAGESVDIDITLQPNLPGEKFAGLRLEVVGSTSPYVLLLSGSAQYALISNLQVSDNSIDFGQVVQGEQAETTIVLTNSGDALAPVINVSNVQLSGVNSGAFSAAFVPVSLAPGETVNLTIQADTTTLGAKSATLEVFHDGNNGSQSIDLQANVCGVDGCLVNFTSSTVNANVDFSNATTLQFGPDDRLYVGEMNGPIIVLDVTRTSSNSYVATELEEIELIKNVINHNDDGTRDYASKRLLTGIHVTGTASNPVIYAASSDPRQAAGPSDIPGGNDVGLDTNSGILHQLTKNNDGSWTKIDLVRGLPRSEENHVINGLVKVGSKIYLNVGGNTNKGLPSINFATLPEYALSSAVLEIDLDMIGGVTYDIPTLDGPADEFDPFGGHDGLNQAKLVEGGPISLFATGLRNPYDIVYTESGRFYVWDNGPDTGWGGEPDNSCLNVEDNSGLDAFDGLHLISSGYYAGHPNPTRGNKSNTFGGQSPIEGAANPIECEYRTPGDASGALTLNAASTNGLDEYTASNFSGEMKSDLIAVTFGNELLRVQLNNSGNQVTSKEVLVSGVGTSPLDVTTQSDAQIFPGTIWIADWSSSDLIVLEPSDY